MASEISPGSLWISWYLYFLPSRIRLPALTLALQPLDLANAANALLSHCSFACVSVTSSLKYTLSRFSKPWRFFRLRNTAAFSATDGKITTSLLGLTSYSCALLWFAAGLSPLSVDAFPLLNTAVQTLAANSSFKSFSMPSSNSFAFSPSFSIRPSITSMFRRFSLSIC